MFKPTKFLVLAQDTEHTSNVKPVLVTLTTEQHDEHEAASSLALQHLKSDGYELDELDIIGCTKLENIDSVVENTDQSLNENKEENYSVLVRAIISTDKLIEHTFGSSDWELYDHSIKDGGTTFRLDTLVVVSASSKEDAIEKAKENTPVLPSYAPSNADVTIWVDDQDDDVVLVNTLNTQKEQK